MVTGFSVLAAVFLLPTPAFADSVAGNETTGGTAVSSGTAASSSTAAPDDSLAAPQLKIELTADHDTAVAGDSINYTVTVENFGTDLIESIDINQTIGAGMLFESADADGTQRSEAVHWTTDIEPGQTATFHATMSVSSTPEELLRLASVACATLEGQSAPLVCASQSAQLPAGAAAEAQRDDENSSGTWVLYSSIGAAVLILAAAAFLFRRRRAGTERAGRRHLRRD